jgi:hypothetical protein
MLYYVSYCIHNINFFDEKKAFFHLTAAILTQNTVSLQCSSFSKRDNDADSLDEGIILV